MSQEDKPPYEIEERMSCYCVPGVGIAIFQDGQIEWRGSHGVLEVETDRNVTPDSPFHACSMSKMVTALGVLRLVQEGVLDLDEDVNRFLTAWQVPDHSHTAHDKVTLRSLLAHQGGFIDPEGSFDICQEHEPFPSPRDILMGHTRYHSEPAQVKYIPESQFAYSDAGYTVIEQIIEDVTGASFAAVMDRLVIEPLGLRQTFIWDDPAGTGAAEIKARAAAGHDKFGRVVEGKRAHYPNLSGAGLWTTPAEMSALALEVINAWNGDAGSILHPDMARRMLTGYGCTEEVGLGVFLPHSNGEIRLVSQGWGVGFQCMMVAYPRLRSGIVVMTNSEPGKPQHDALIGEVLREISNKYEWPGI